MAARDRIPALLLVALLHGAAVFAFLHALIVEREPAKRTAEPHETEITLSRPPPPPRVEPPRKHHAPGTGPGAITAPFFNPYTYQTPPALAKATEGLAMALSACDPTRRDMASREVRAACDRIGLALMNDRGHFGVIADISDPKHWERELARREAPYLAPCMTPNGPDALYALTCIYKLLFGGYDSENRPRYSQ